MHVSVETVKGLERKVTISVPTEKVEEEVSLRLKNMVRKVKVDGFRPGKVPFSVVKKRFSHGVREEVAREMVQSTLFEALKEQKLVPAGSPYVEPEPIELGKDFQYTALFEVLPTIEIQELNKEKIEHVIAEVNDQDVNDMLEKLREQNKMWTETSRPVAEGDKVILDFEGFLDDEPFEGGKAEGYELIIGSGNMIPGFEDGLVGGEKDKEFSIQVTFPKDYHHSELAGKQTAFKIVIKHIMEGLLPELDTAFAEKFNIKEGGIEALKKDIKENMVRELERRVSNVNREKIFDELLKLNAFDIPNALVDQEIEHLKHDMYHRMFGHEHKEDEEIPDFPRILFEEQAQRRVRLGLLFSEYVKKHELFADKGRVDAMVDQMASAYEKPEELRDWYRSSKERLANIEALVLEEMVAEKIAENAELVDTKMTYESVMNPKKETEDKEGSKDKKESGEKGE